MLMAKDLTVKQRRFVTALVEHGNATQAVLDAGYNAQDRLSAKAMGAENMAKPVIRNALDVALAQRGIDEYAIATGVARLMGSDNLTHVARGIDLLLKIHGDVAPKKSLQVKLSYAEQFHQSYTERAGQGLAKGENKQPTATCLTTD